MGIVILIDIDDTIENLCSAWCKWLSKKHHLKVRRKDITEWDITKFFPELTDNEVFAPLSNPLFWETVKPKRGAVKYVKKLIDSGYDVYLCTSTSHSNVDMKYRTVIQKYFPYISWEQVIVASNKKMIKGDVIIDDNPDNLSNPFTLDRKMNILMKAPHNKKDPLRFKHIRTGSWRKIYSEINKRFKGGETYRTHNFVLDRMSKVQNS